MIGNPSATSACPPERVASTALRRGAAGLIVDRPLRDLRLPESGFVLRVEDTDAARNTEEARGEVVNVGSDEEITILGLAERVKERAGSDSPIEFIPYDEAYAEGFEDMPRRVPDVSKLLSITGFRPERSLDETIDDVLAELRG